MIDTGIDPYVGVAAWLEAHKQNEFKYRPAQDRTAVQRFGEMTAAEGFLLLLPLFVVLVTFGAVSGEREQGTLRQVLSLGVRRADLIRGKALGVAGALSLVLIPATVAGIIGLALTSEFGSLRIDLPRVLLLGLGYLLYFATWIGIGLGVSARARTSRSALVVLLAFWFANTLVIPRAASDLAAAVYRSPSAAAFQAAMEQELADQTAVEGRLERRRAELLRQYNATSVGAIPLNFSGIALQEGEEHGNEVFDKHYGRLFGIYRQQNVLQQGAGLVAPLLPVRSLSMALSGTDFEHHRAFVHAAEEYRRLIQRVMNDDIAANARPGVVYTAGGELWERVPEFRYEQPSTAAVLSSNGLSLGLLIVWLCAAVAFAETGAPRGGID